MSQEDFQFFLLLNGCFLLDFSSDSLRILIANIHDHEITIAINPDLSKHERLAAAQDYEILRLEGAAKVIPGDDAHLVFDRAKVRAVIENQNNPLAHIVLPFPDAVLGQSRYQVDTHELLGDRPEDILPRDRETIVFCERTVLAWNIGAKVKMTSSATRREYDALDLGDGRSFIALTSRLPEDRSMPGFHGDPFNDLLVLQNGSHPALKMTGISRYKAAALPDDSQIEQLRLPTDPRRFIEGTGCGIGIIG